MSSSSYRRIVVVVVSVAAAMVKVQVASGDGRMVWSGVACARAVGGGAKMAGRKDGDVRR